MLKRDPGIPRDGAVLHRFPAAPLHPSPPLSVRVLPSAPHCSLGDDRDWATYPSFFPPALPPPACLQSNQVDEEDLTTSVEELEGYSAQLEPGMKQKEQDLRT
jgi:hypothetical protein